MDKKKGGVRPGAGRPKKADEQKANALMSRALRELYKKELDDEAKVAFIKDLLEGERGQLFVAQHLFGKPTEKIDHTTNGEAILDKAIKINIVKPSDE